MCGSVSVALGVILLITSAWSLQSDQEFWRNLAQAELTGAIEAERSIRTAKNVILFIGDGLDPNTATAARIYQGGESHSLSFEKFPHIGLLKTYSANKMVPDSACTATALLTGVKTNSDVVAVDATVERRDCARSLLAETRLKSLAAEALDLGKSAGFVTTMRVTHATPAPLYSHSADRSWECESLMPSEASQCKDIGRQLIEDKPGRNLNVILGGGRNSLVTPENPTPNPWTCIRNDGRNLIEEYRQDKENRNLTYSIVSNNGELRSFDADSTDYLLGIFASSHLSYEYERNNGTDGMPSIGDMVEAAIKVLQKNENGFFLMVEGGNIDMAHHRGRAKVAVTETLAFDEAVELAEAMTDDDTLIIVTSDHTHTLSINGYPDRGSDIFGIAEESTYDGINYTTLSYSTGGPDAFQYDVVTNENNEAVVERRNPSLEDTTSPDYVQVAGIRLIENSHGGGDVIVYAKGPHAHLFHNVHEQHYVYYAVMHAMTYSGAHCAGAARVLVLTLLSGIIAKMF